MQYDYVIIDVEIGNEIPKGKDWDNKLGQVTCVGLLFVLDNEPAVISQLFKFKGNKDFAGQVFTSLQAIQLPLYALNAPFEMDTLEVLTGNRFPIKELRNGLKGHLSSKEALYNFLFRKNLVNEIVDVYYGEGGRCINEYKDYERSGEYKFAQRILWHNQNCLLKEHLIKKHIDVIQAAAKVDSKGFITELK